MNIFNNDCDKSKKLQTKCSTLFRISFYYISDLVFLVLIWKYLFSIYERYHYYLHIQILQQITIYIYIY